MKILKDALKEWCLLTTAVVLFVILLTLFGIKVHDRNTKARYLAELLSGLDISLEEEDEPQIILEVFEYNEDGGYWHPNAAFASFGDQITVRARIENLSSSVQLSELDFIYNDEVVAIAEPDVFVHSDGAQTLGSMWQELTMSTEAWTHGATDEIIVTTKGDFELMSSIAIFHPLYFMPFRMILFYIILILLALGIIIMILVTPKYCWDEEDDEDE